MTSAAGPHRLDGGLGGRSEGLGALIVGLGDLDDLSAFGAQPLEVSALVLVSLGREEMGDRIRLAWLKLAVPVRIGEVELGQVTTLDEPVQVAGGEGELVVEQVQTGLQGWVESCIAERLASSTKSAHGPVT